MSADTPINDLRDARAFLDYLHWEQEDTNLEHVQAALDWLFLHVGPARLAEGRPTDDHPFNDPQHQRNWGKVPNPYLYLCQVMQSMDFSERPVGRFAEPGELFQSFRKSPEKPETGRFGNYYVRLGNIFDAGKPAPSTNQGLGIPQGQNKPHLYVVTGPGLAYLRAKVSDAIRWRGYRSKSDEAARWMNERRGRDFRRDYLAGGGTQWYFARPDDRLRWLDGSGRPG